MITIQKRTFLKFSIAGSLLSTLAITPVWAQSASGLAESAEPSESPSGAPVTAATKPIPASPSGTTAIDLKAAEGGVTRVKGNDYSLDVSSLKANQEFIIFTHKDGQPPKFQGRFKTDETGHFTFPGHLGQGPGQYKVEIWSKDKERPGPPTQNWFPDAHSFTIDGSTAKQDPPPIPPGVSQLAIKANEPATPFSQNAVLSMTRDPSSPNVFYGLARDWKKNTLNIMRSDDGGETWNTVGQQSNSTGFSLDRLTVGKRQADGSQDIFLSTPDGVFRSTDQGKTLTLFDGTGNKKASDVKVSEDGQHLVVGSSSGVETFNRDSAGKWTASPTLSAGAPAHVTAVQIDPLNPRVVYAGAGPLLYRWDGQKWSHFTLPGTGAFREDHNVVSIEVDRTSGKLVETTCQGAYVAQVDDPRAKSVKPNVQITKIRSNAIIDHRPFLDDYPYAPRPNPNYNRPNPNYLRAFDAKVNPANANQMVIVGASGMYFQNKGHLTRINTAAALDSVSPAQTQTSNATPKIAKAEYRSVVWSSDGKYFIVSGETGTFKFRVSGSTVTLTGEVGNLTVSLAEPTSTPQSRGSSIGAGI